MRKRARVAKVHARIADELLACQNLHAAGIPSSDLANASMADWESLARTKGLSFPIGRPARAALIRDTINAVKQREAQGRVQ
jgi:hypothetical protein